MRLFSFRPTELNETDIVCDANSTSTQIMLCLVAGIVMEKLNEVH